MYGRMQNYLVPIKLYYGKLTAMFCPWHCVRPRPVWTTLQILRSAQMGCHPSCITGEMGLLLSLSSACKKLKEDSCDPTWGPSALDWKCWWVWRKWEGMPGPCFCPSLNTGSKLRYGLLWNSKFQATSLTMCLRDYQYHRSVRGMVEEFQYSERLK